MLWLDCNGFGIHPFRQMPEAKNKTLNFIRRKKSKEND